MKTFGFVTHLRTYVLFNNELCKGTVWFFAHDIVTGGSVNLQSASSS
jgi:hypothetical protein